MYTHFHIIHDWDNWTVDNHPLTKEDIYIALTIQDMFG